MADRPILFSAPMVRALLEGHKTQTRRVLAPSRAFFGSAPKSYWEHADFARAFVDGRPESGQYLHVPCHIADDGDGEPDSSCALCDWMGWQGTVHRLYPRVEVGDRLWVKEAWQGLSFGDYLPMTQRPCDLRWAATDPLAAVDKAVRGYPWRPGIHMPRWASRLTLHVTDVRVQRLQDISEADAIDEGVEQLNDSEVYPIFRNYLAPPKSGPGALPAARESYRTLWNSINGPDSWIANPWVVALTFTVEHANIDAARAAA